MTVPRLALRRHLSLVAAAFLTSFIGLVGTGLVPAPAAAQGSAPVVVEPGQNWTATLQLDGTLEIEARIPYDRPAGANYVLEVRVNGRPVTDPLLNKQSPMRYADGRNYPYREPTSARWMLFYSHDYTANNGPAGGGYEVRTDPGQAYRYVWNVAPLIGGGGVAQVQFRNMSEPPVPVEIRVLSGQPSGYSTGSPAPAPAPKKKGWLGGLADVLKDVTKDGAKPAETTGGYTPSTPQVPSTPYGATTVQGQPRLAMYAVGQILGHSDFDYPLVVQLQDGSGRPMYPPSPVTVTITSRQPDIVRFYGAARPETATITLRPAGASGSDGLSWDKVQVTAANNWVAGTATFIASAPGYPDAAVTVTTVPARTRDNRSTPAQLAPAARVSLTVMPPMVEVNRRPVIYMDLVDARGQPTGVDFGPGDWMLDSSNPAVFPSYANRGRNVTLTPVGPGRTELSLRSKRPGVAGSDATLIVVTPGAPMTTEYVPPPADRSPDAPHLTVYAVGQILGHSDFDYPVVVQLQDAAGQPMYPPSPLAVTITSRQPDIVRFYGAARPEMATVTLKPAGPSGTGGLSWDRVRVTAANNWVAGIATIVASAPGYADAAVTVTTVPARTRDNRSTPAQLAPAARVGLAVMPPVTEVDHRPVIWMDLLDAGGQPTGVDFGPGEWVLESSNPAVYTSYASSGRSADLMLGVGQTRFTVRSKRPGVAGSDATVTVITPGAPAASEYAAPRTGDAPGFADAPPFPAATGGRVAAGIDFGDPVGGPSGRIWNIVTAHGVTGGAAEGITGRFTPDVNPIHVWFKLAGFAPGSLLTSRWTYLGGAAPLVIGTGEFTTGAMSDYGTFSYELAPGKRWPAGDYRVEILLNNTVLGSTAFLVESLAGRDSPRVPPPVDAGSPPDYGTASVSGLLARLQETNRFRFDLHAIRFTCDVYDGSQTRRTGCLPNFYAPHRGEFALRWSGGTFTSHIEERLDGGMYQADLRGTVSGDGLTIRSLHFSATTTGRTVEVSSRTGERRAADRVQRWVVEMADLPVWDEAQVAPAPKRVGSRAPECLTRLEYSDEETWEGRLLTRQAVTDHAWNIPTSDTLTIETVFWTR